MSKSKRAMCGGKAKSTEQFHQSESDSTGRGKNEFKRPREVNSSWKPPLPPFKRQVAPPPPSKPTREADVSRDCASDGKAPPGVFDLEFPVPKPSVDFEIRQFYDVFFKSLVDSGASTKPIVMERSWLFDEIMDPDMERIWHPILCQPLIPIVYKKRCTRF